jgi:hypothetical protein
LGEIQIERLMNHQPSLLQIGKGRKRTRRPDRGERRHVAALCHGRRITALIGFYR